MEIYYGLFEEGEWSGIGDLESVNVQGQKNTFKGKEGKLEKVEPQAKEAKQDELRKNILGEALWKEFLKKKLQCEILQSMNLDTGLNGESMKEE